MDPILGQVQLFPFSFAMEGWLPCQGQLLQVMQNQALFSLFGATYGGDGRNNFGIPDLRGAEPVPGMCYYIATQGMYPQRA